MDALECFVSTKRVNISLWNFLLTFLISKFLTNEIQRTAFNASGVKYFNLSKLSPPRPQYRNSEGEPHSERGAWHWVNTPDSPDSRKQPFVREECENCRSTLQSYNITEMDFSFYPLCLGLNTTALKFKKSYENQYKL